MKQCDVVVIGGGIAGVSAAYYLVEAGRTVVLVEQETSLAFHTTGRSAALFFQNYGHNDIRCLSTASRRFLEKPPAELVDTPLLSPRGALVVAFEDQREQLAQLQKTSLDAVFLSPGEISDMVPVIAGACGGMYETGASDIDVAGLHQAFVRGIRRDGGEIRTAWGVTRLSPGDSGWRVGSSDDSIECDVVVNAAGAWGDQLAMLAGLKPVGLVPKRRTAFMVAAPENAEAWPAVTDTVMSFYFKPDGTQLLCSPADETPSEPCDARPQEIDIAQAIDRINDVTSLAIRSVRSAWAGLRTFCPDGSMALGSDPAVESFVWLVGQGGTGIQTAPAAGRLVADLVTSGQPSPDLRDAGIDAQSLAPDRLLATG